MFHHALHLITNLGDSGLLTVTAFLTSLYLYMVGNHRAALALSLALVSCMGVMTLLKIVFISCHQLIPWLHLRSPSGHAAMSAAIMGTMAIIFARNFSGWRKYTAVALAFMLVLIIAASRHLLGYHSRSEVLAGLLVGLFIAFSSFLFLKNAPKVPFRTRYVALTIAVAVLLFYGSHTPAEGFITKLAAFLNGTLHFCS